MNKNTNENRYVPRRIYEIEEYSPACEYYKIRLDANESPCPPPDGAVKRMTAAMAAAAFNRYPDPAARELREAFAKAYKTDADCVVAGNGSDELISLLMNMFLRAGDTVAVTAPDFSMYAFYASLIGCKIITVGKDKYCGIDFDAFARAVNENNCKLVIFSNPCNPTGVAYDRERILGFYNKVDCPVIVDEAYMEFCRGGCSVLDLCGGGEERLIVLKTLSKAFAGAGLRVGFSVSHPGVASALRRVKSPYNLNSVSQECGKILLEGCSCVTEYAADTAKRTREMREALIGFSKENALYETAESDANFVLLTFSDRTPENESSNAEKIFSYLKENSIIVRFPDRTHLRITCGTEEENAVFLNKFFEIAGTLS